MKEVAFQDFGDHPVGLLVAFLIRDRLMFLGVEDLPHSWHRFNAKSFQGIYELLQGEFYSFQEGSVFFKAFSMVDGSFQIIQNGEDAFQQALVTKPHQVSLFLLHPLLVILKLCSQAQPLIEGFSRFPGLFGKLILECFQRRWLFFFLRRLLGPLVLRPGSFLCGLFRPCKLESPPPSV